LHYILSRILKKSMRLKSTLLFALFFIKTVYSQQTLQDKIDSLELVRQDQIKRYADPNTGLIPTEELQLAREAIIKSQNMERTTNAAITPNLVWYERGPKDTGGFVKALIVDPNDSQGKKVWAGSSNGGLWYNLDISNINSPWVQVNGGDSWASLNITTIAFNPSNPLEMYIGTGDLDFGKLNPGSGMYKSTDGGQTFSRLLSSVPNSNIQGTISHSFQYIFKICLNSMGHVFANTHNGLLKSSDGGNSWVFILTSQRGSDLEIGKDDIVYASFGSFQSNTAKIYRSNDASATSWAEITPSASGGKVEMALGNSLNRNSQVIYALAQNAGGSWFKKTTNGGSTWTDVTIPRDPYNNSLIDYSEDISIIVDPTSNDKLFFRNGYLMKSINGGLNWSDATYYVDLGDICLVSDGLVFSGRNGILYSSDFRLSGTSVLRSEYRNKGLRIMAFQNASMENIADSPIIYGAGAKIGGGLYSLGTNLSRFSGYYDKAYVDQENSNVVIFGSYIYDSNLNFVSSLGLSSSHTSYDSPNNIMYAYKASGSGWISFDVVANVGTTNSKTTVTINQNIFITKLLAGLTPYTLYVASFDGKLYKIVNMNTTPSVIEIGGGQLPFGTYASSLDFGVDENRILITYSNYGVSSVFYTSNGGGSWTNKDVVGDGLPNVVVNAGVFAPKNSNKVALATDLGVYTTNDISNTSPNWELSNTGLPNVACNGLYVRAADSMMVVSTEGRGVFITPIRGYPNPTILSEFNKTIVCKSGVIQVPFTTMGNFTSGTVFQVQLSDASGSFANSTVLNSGTSSPISAVIPQNIESSNNYRIRLATQSPSPIISNNTLVKLLNVSDVYISIQSPIGNIESGTYRFCEGASVSLFAFSAQSVTGSEFNFQWNGPNGFAASGTNISLVNSSSTNEGIYSITTDIESCGVFTKSVQLLTTTQPQIFLNSIEQVKCPGTNINLYANNYTFVSPTTSYSWTGPNNFSSATQNAVVSAAGTNAGGVYTFTATYTGACASIFTSTVNIVISSVLPVSISYNPSACVGGNIQLYSNLTTSDYLANISYSWSGPNGFNSNVKNPTVANISSNSFGIYTVTVSYSGVCTGSNTATTSLTLAKVDEFDLYISSNSPACLNSTVSLQTFFSSGSTSLDRTYSWSGPNNFTANTAFPTIYNLSQLAEGVYTLTVNYSGACSGLITATTSVSIRNSLPVSISQNTLSCFGSTLNLEANVLASTSGLNLTYTWTGPNNFTSNLANPSINNFQSDNQGTYNLAVSYTGSCNGTSFSSRVININSPSAYINGLDTYCVGATATLQGSLNLSEATTSYSWTGPNGFSSTEQTIVLSNISDANFGVYTLTVSYSGECVGTATNRITIRKSADLVGRSNSGKQFCVGSNAQIYMDFTTWPSSFSWSGPNNFTSDLSYLDIPSVSTVHAGVYTLTAIYSNGCNVTTTATTAIYINNTPPTHYIDQDGIGGTYCLGSSPVYFSVANEDNFFSIQNIQSVSWTGPNGFSRSGNSVSFKPDNVNKSGTYTASISFVGGCAQTMTATTNITIKESPFVKAFISSGIDYLNSTVEDITSIEYCEGNYVYVFASTNDYVNYPVQYSWSGPNSFSAQGMFSTIPINGTANAGIYTVTANIPSGACVGTATTTVQLIHRNSPNAAISVSPANYIAGEPVVLSSNCATKTLWNFDLTQSNFVNTITYTALSGDDLYAKCEDEHGCISKPSPSLRFNQCSGDLGLMGEFSNLLTKFESNAKISSNSKISPVSNIVYDAKNNIELLPGFEVKSGSVFKAQIDGCGNN
jgi:trimeric autotransporter adhesin